MICLFISMDGPSSLDHPGSEKASECSHLVFKSFICFVFNRFIRISKSSTSFHVSSKIIPWFGDAAQVAVRCCFCGSGDFTLSSTTNDVEASSNAIEDAGSLLLLLLSLSSSDFSSSANASKSRSTSPAPSS